MRKITTKRADPHPARSADWLHGHHSRLRGDGLAMNARLRDDGRQAAVDGERRQLAMGVWIEHGDGKRWVRGFGTPIGSGG